METYKTWEAVKMLTENPNLEFEDENTNARILTTEKGFTNIATIKYTKPFGGELLLNGKWILKQKPVSFMEAAEACFHGKTIICKIGNETFEYAPITQPTYNAIGDKNGIGLFLMGILQGKWYIKEDEK